MNILALMCAISACITHVACETFIKQSPLTIYDESTSSIDCLLLIREVLILNRTDDDDDDDHIWCCEDDTGIIHEIVGLDSSFYDDNDALSGKSRLYSNQAIKFQDPTTAAPRIMIGPDAIVKNVQDQSRRSLSPVTGTHSVLIVRVISADGAPSRSASLLADDVFGMSSDTVNLASQYSACSAGKLQFVPATGTNIVNGVLEVTIPQRLNGVSMYTAEGYVTSAIKSLGFSSYWLKFYILQNGVSFGGAAAYAYVSSYLSVYWDTYIYMVMVQVHEVGHNLGMYHSGEGSLSYDDHTCMMGNPQYADEQPKMCFNGQKSWFLTWYNDRHASAQPTSASWQGKLAGIDDYVGGNTISGQHYVILRIIDTTSISHLYVMYNRKKGVTSGVVEYPDMVTVVKGFNGNTYAFQGYIQTALSANQEYRINNFSGQSSTLVIKVCYMESGTPDYAYVLIYLVNAPLSCPVITTNPTKRPTLSPTKNPTKRPTLSPTKNPTKRPTLSPTKNPSSHPSGKPSLSITPSTIPSFVPSDRPSSTPSLAPTKNPTLSQRPSKSSVPSNIPSKSPSSQPSRNPSKKPTRSPTKSPTNRPTLSPTKSPTKRPTLSPTKNPTKRPTMSPTKNPTKRPTLSPTKNPTKRPTLSPTNSPTKRPSFSPTTNPTKRPTLSPTKAPTLSPTKSPTRRPTNALVTVTVVNCNRHTKSKTCRKDPSECCKWDSNNRTCSNKPNCQPLNCGANTQRETCVNDGSGCCRWNINRNECVESKNCETPEIPLPPTKRPTKQPTINCSPNTSKTTCHRDSSGCCKWKVDTCISKQNCKTNVNCSDYTKNEKQCNRASKCCRWRNGVCKTQSFCSESSEGIVNLPPCKRHTKRNKCERDTSSCCRWNSNEKCVMKGSCSQSSEKIQLQPCKRHTKRNKCERDTSGCCRWNSSDEKCIKRTSCKRQK